MKWLDFYLAKGGYSAKGGDLAKRFDPVSGTLL